MAKPGKAAGARIDWAAAAGRVAGGLGARPVHPSVAAWAVGRAAGERWGIALSGGADSVAALLVVWHLWPERRKGLRVFHFDHGLRGSESRGDAAFCERVCAGLGVPLVTKRWVRADKTGPRSGSRARAGGAGAGRAAPVSEAEARDARQAFLERAGRRRRVAVFFFGHHRDDVAETLLMRLARGSGSAGLAAPRPVQELFGKVAAGPRAPVPGGAESRRSGGDGGGAGGVGARWHLRPLLGTARAEIRAALAAAGVPWREDSSNRGRDHFRNRIRLDVLPRWVEASGRDAGAGAALSRELLEEDDRALEAWVEGLGAVPASDGSLPLAPLAGKPRAVARRSLHRWLAVQPAAGRLVRQGFEALLEAVIRGEPVRQSLGKKGFAVIRRGRLRFEAAVGAARRRAVH